METRSFSFLPLCVCFFPVLLPSDSRAFTPDAGIGVMKREGGKEEGEGEEKCRRMKGKAERDAHKKGRGRGTRREGISFRKLLCTLGTYSMYRTKNAN